MRENIWMCLYEIDLIHLKWLFPVVYIFLHLAWLHVFVNEWNSNVQNTFVYPSVVGHHNLAIVNRPAINSDMQASLWYANLKPFQINKCPGVSLRTIFSFWGTSILSSVVVEPGCVSTWSVQGISCPDPHHHLMLFVFLMNTIWLGKKWSFHVVLICVSLMVNEAEHFSMYLLAICSLPFENCLLISLAIVHIV